MKFRRPKPPFAADEHVHDASFEARRSLAGMKHSWVVLCSARASVGRC